MNYTLITLFGFSISVAAIVGWIRVKQISPIYYPFLICIWLALLNETLSFVLEKAGLYSNVNNNIYVLGESLLISWQFQKWKLLSRKMFIIVMAGLILTWTIENIIINSIFNITSYYRILYSFLIVLMSITQLNVLIARERKSLFKNSAFLLCIGFIIYYTYKVLVEMFWLYGLNSGSGFRKSVYAILLYLNFFVNLIYALAVLWMPRKHRFSLPS